MCKKKYPNRRQAKQAARLLTRQYGTLKGIYWCFDCEAYHIGGSHRYQEQLILPVKDKTRERRREMNRKHRKKK